MTDDRRHDDDLDFDAEFVLDDDFSDDFLDGVDGPSAGAVAGVGDAVPSDARQDAFFDAVADPDRSEEEDDLFESDAAAGESVVTGSGPGGAPSDRDAADGSADADWVAEGDTFEDPAEDPAFGADDHGCVADEAFGSDDDGFADRDELATQPTAFEDADDDATWLGDPDAGGTAGSAAVPGFVGDADPDVAWSQEELQAAFADERAAEPDQDEEFAEHDGSAVDAHRVEAGAAGDEPPTFAGLRLSNDRPPEHDDDWTEDFAEADDLFAELEVEAVDRPREPDRSADAATPDVAAGAERVPEGADAETVQALHDLLDGPRDDLFDAFDGLDAAADEPVDPAAEPASRTREDRDGSRDDLFDEFDEIDESPDPAAEPAPWAREDLGEVLAFESDSETPAGAGFGGLELRDALPVGDTAPPVGDATAADGVEAAEGLEDALFGSGRGDVVFNEFTGDEAGPQFSEDGPGWPGADADVAAIVTAADDEDTGSADLFELDDVEIEQLDPADRARVAATLGEERLDDIAFGFGEDDAADGSTPVGIGSDADGDQQNYVLVDDQEAFAAELGPLEMGDDGPPLDVDEDDPIYGGESEAAAAAAGIPGMEMPAARVDAEPRPFEDDPYVDDTADDYEVHVVGPGVSRGRAALWGTAAALAALLLVGGLGVVLLAPEWLGLTPRSAAVDRTLVARPSLGLTWTAPALPVESSTTPTPTVVEGGPDPAPTTPDPVATTDGSDPDPAPTDPSPVEDAPQPSDPVAGVDTPADPTPLPPLPAPAPKPDQVAIADPPAPSFEPRSAERSPGAVSRAEARRRERARFEPVENGDQLVIAGPTRDTAGLGGDVVDPGDRAFAQLSNDSVFVGTVRKIDLATITLDLQPGQVTLVRRDLVALMAFDDSIGAEYVHVQRGYVDIQNRGRLHGRVVHTATPEIVVLETDDSRVIVPREQVVDVGSFDGNGVDLGTIDDEATSRWLRDRALRRLQTGSPTATPRRASPPR